MIVDGRVMTLLAMERNERAEVDKCTGVEQREEALKPSSDDEGVVPKAIMRRREGVDETLPEVDGVTRPRLRGVCGLSN
jgi:hypothetical protein